jgi:methylated-DNA-[protein]-cysteine S-methyltransferase
MKHIKNFMTITSLIANTPTAINLVATYHASPVGQLLLCSNGTALTGIYFADRPHALTLLANATLPNATLDPKLAPSLPNPLDDVLKKTIQQLDQYFIGALTVFDIPIALVGTNFQQRVWQQLLTLNYGESITYLDLAKRLDQPLAVRAVGAAVGQNPISIIVPCHRVQGANGQLRGYAGGLERKRWLIDHEYHQQSLWGN